VPTVASRGVEPSVVQRHQVHDDAAALRGSGALRHAGKWEKEQDTETTSSAPVCVG
jgi:hypothetical protein